MVLDIDITEGTGEEERME
jgi:isoaspartyl peptidase/L-asparaginase-like protein (Ntn-hydrolase superfamily)